MNRRIGYILSVVLFSILSSCTMEELRPQEKEMGEVRFSVVDTSKVDVVTKGVMGFDVNLFNVELHRNSDVVFSARKYGDVVGTTISCLAGNGYVLKAESCTEAEAELLNDGWGQMRVAGEKSFAVAANSVTDVPVHCGVANSSVKVNFSDYIKRMFSEYAVKINAADVSTRQFVFNDLNYSYKSAYFNVGAGGRAMQYVVSLTLLGKAPQEYTKTFTLEASKSYNLTIALDDETKSKLTVQLSVDGTLIREEIIRESINPYLK